MISYDKILYDMMMMMMMMLMMTMVLRMMIMVMLMMRLKAQQNRLITINNVDVLYKCFTYINAERRNHDNCQLVGVGCRGNKISIIDNTTVWEGHLCEGDLRRTSDGRGTCCLHFRPSPLSGHWCLDCNNIPNEGGNCIKQINIKFPV